jgi:hypothetical protein
MYSCRSRSYAYDKKEQVDLRNQPVQNQKEFISWERILSFFTRTEFSLQHPLCLVAKVYYAHHTFRILYYNFGENILLYEKEMEIYEK